MRKRSEASESAVVPKTSAAERTVPLPGVALSNAHLKCHACGDAFTESEVLVDGARRECPSCGALLGDGNRVNPGQRAAAPPPKVNPRDLPKAFCEDCGAEWARTALNDYRPFPNCGHANGFVDDPSKAKRRRLPRGTRSMLVDASRCTATSTESTDQDVKAQHDPYDVKKQPDEPRKVRLAELSDDLSFKRASDGRRVSVEWGKANFEIMPHQHMSVGPFSLSADVDEDGALPTAKALLVELEEIADVAFDAELAWYKKRLGLIK